MYNFQYLTFIMHDKHGNLAKLNYGIETKFARALTILGCMHYNIYCHYIREQPINSRPYQMRANTAHKAFIQSSTRPI